MGVQAGRGTYEKVYGELKTGFAFGGLPSVQYAADSAWQWLSVLAFDLSRSFQLATTAPRRRPSRDQSMLRGRDAAGALARHFP